MREWCNMNMEKCSLLSLESSPLLLEDSDTSNCAYCKLVIGNILKNSNGNKCDQCNVMIHPNFTAYHKCGYPNCPICKNPITNSQYWRHIRSHPGHENDSPSPPRKTFENREYKGRYGSGSSSSSNNNNRRGNFNGGSPPVSKPPIEVGKEYEVEITEINSQGDGIARIQGFVIFVKWGGKVGKKVKIRAMEVGSKSAIATIVY